MQTRTLALAFAALLVVPARTPAADGDPPGLTVRMLSLRLAEGGRATGAVRLEATFLPQLAPAGYDPEVHGAVVTIGPTVVTSLPPVDARATLREKSPFVWDYRERPSRTRPGRRTVGLDFTTGTLRVVVRGLDLSALQEYLPGAVPVTLALGDIVYSAEVEPAPRGRCWAFAGPEPPAPAPPRPGPPWTPAPDPPPDPSPPAAVTLRPLGSGPLGIPSTAQEVVARDAAEYAALWALCHPPGTGGPAAPAVDFGKEVVVAVFVGNRLTGGFEAAFLGVQASGDGARVDFEERAPGPRCIVTMAATRPFAVAALTRVAGAVTFRRTLRIVDCP